MTQSKQVLITWKTKTINERRRYLRVFLRETTPKKTVNKLSPRYVNTFLINILQVDRPTQIFLLTVTQIK